jgi:hypothetical protein
VFGRTFSPAVLAQVSALEDMERNLARLLRADIMWKTAGISCAPYQPMPKPSSFVSSALSCE